VNLILRLEIPLPEPVEKSENREEEIKKLTSHIKTSARLIVNTEDIKADYWLDSDE